MINTKQRRKVFLQARVVYVDETVLHGFSAEQRTTHLNKIINFCKDFKLACEIIPLERIYSLDNEVIDSFISQESGLTKVGEGRKRSEGGRKNDEEDICARKAEREEAGSKLLRLLKKMPKLGSVREDFTRRMRDLLVVDHATRTKCDYIFLCENQNKICANIISDFCKGRGLQMKENVQTVDERFGSCPGGVKIARPMAKYLDKEVLISTCFHC
jgi:hypothetical protein